MDERELLDRISFDSRVMRGRASIRGTRVTVATVISLVADGMTTGEILADYPHLSREDVRAALAHAACLARGEVISA